MARLGYFPDEFLKTFVQKPARRSPLINRGYYIR
jgi:tRNA wybutosine-synthesizing protein 4